MPELPEVETARRSLLRTVVGKTIERCAVLRRPAVRSHTPAQFARLVRGATITDVERRGKSLRFGLGRCLLAFHYMLGGAVRYHPAAPPPDRGTGLLLRFTDGSGLEFRDLQLSSFHLLPSGKDAAATGAGVDPSAPTTTFEMFRRALGNRGVVKNGLSNQSRIAGIGNLWAHEILFAASLRPSRKIDTLGPAGLRALYRTTRLVLRKAVAAGGEPDFLDALGRPGRYRLMVYGRAGQPCRACGRIIQGGRLGGRPTFFCPACQR